MWVLYLVRYENTIFSVIQPYARCHMVQDHDLAVSVGSLDRMSCKAACVFPRARQRLLRELPATPETGEVALVD